MTLLLLLRPSKSSDGGVVVPPIPPVIPPVTSGGGAGSPGGGFPSWLSFAKEAPAKRKRKKKKKQPDVATVSIDFKFDTESELPKSEPIKSKALADLLDPNVSTKAKIRTLAEIEIDDRARALEEIERKAREEAETLAALEAAKPQPDPNKINFTPLTPTEEDRLMAHQARAHRMEIAEFEDFVDEALLIILMLKN